MGEVDSLASNNEMTASAYVQMDASLFSQAGSKTRIAFPEITESEYPPSTSTTESPTGKWYGPLVDPAYLSKLIVRAPEEVLFDRTDAVTPDFTSKGLWETTTPSLSVYWNGTDLAEESDEQQNLFFAGLLFGIAGPAFIAAAQEFSSKRKERAKRSIEAEGGGDEGG
jgi:hypothetical protein